MNAPLFTRGVIPKDLEFDKVTQGVMRAALLWSVRQLHAEGKEGLSRDLSSGLPPHLQILMSAIAESLDQYAQTHEGAARLNQDPWEVMMKEIGGKDASSLVSALLWEFAPDDQAQWKRK